MQQIIIHIDEKRYGLLLQFLMTLDYVKIVQSASASEAGAEEKESPPKEVRISNQLELLNQRLQGQTRPLFHTISDPIAWQNQVRDEWS